MYKIKVENDIISFVNSVKKLKMNVIFNFPALDFLPCKVLRKYFFMIMLKIVLFFALAKMKNKSCDILHTM